MGRGGGWASSTAARPQSVVETRLSFRLLGLDRGSDLPGRRPGTGSRGRRRTCCLSSLLAGAADRLGRDERRVQDSTRTAGTYFCSGCPGGARRFPKEEGEGHTPLPKEERWRVWWVERDRQTWVILRRWATSSLGWRVIARQGRGANQCRRRFVLGLLLEDYLCIQPAARAVPPRISNPVAGLVVYQ